MTTAAAPRPLPPLPHPISRIHIIGICGTAMGSLAAMLKSQGYDVRGSDAMAYPPMSTWLKDQGIDIMMGYEAQNLDWGPDLVIVGNVVRSTYADAVATLKRGIPYISLPEALRHFFLRGERNLVVTGTHGKTTTTSMLAWICLEAGLDPGFLIGGIAGNTGTNHRVSSSDLFVIEGDEYDTAFFDKVPKFWHYAPTRATINNLEFDHADIYEDVEAIEAVFEAFCRLIPSHGSLWVNGDDPRALKVSQEAKAPRFTFGLSKGCDLRAGRITQVPGGQEVTVVRGGEELVTVVLPLVGEFNVRNMLGAMALAMDEGVSAKGCKRALESFKNTRKRQELVGEVEDILVFDDFAHHPTAVGHTLGALRERYEDRKIWAIFETKSNTSRRRIFQDEYPPALAQADEVILSKPWKRDDMPAHLLMDINQLRADIQARGPRTQILDPVEAIVAYLAEHLKPHDLVVGLSGSAFEGFHHKLLAALKDRFSAP